MSKDLFRKLIFAFFVFIIFAMDGVLIFSHFRLMQDSGVSMGVGFLQLVFLTIGVPIIITFYILKPSRRWWYAMLPVFSVFLILLFK